MIYLLIIILILIALVMTLPMYNTSRDDLAMMNLYNKNQIKIK